MKKKVVVDRRKQKFLAANQIHKTYCHRVVIMIFNFGRIKTVVQTKNYKPQKSAEDIILSLPHQEQMIMKRLRSLILDCLPKATEKVSYGVPFYNRNRMICFIWPPSIFWGPKRTLETQQAVGVGMGFCQGNRMSNEDGVLLAEGRKQTYCIYFHSLKDIHENQLRALLFEAGMVDESFAKKKRALKMKN